MAYTSTVPTLDHVLPFWFGEPAADPETLGSKLRRWYAGGQALDAEIRERFSALLDRAVAGEIEVPASARDRLALIVVLDQFPRSVCRDTPQAYAGDARAQALARELFDAGEDAGFSLEERLFLIMPLVHAEDLALQERGVAEMERLVATAPAALRPLFGMGIEQSRKYRDVIARFGRFPHRNAILGRESTAEELAVLRDWAERAPPSEFKARTGA